MPAESLEAFWCGSGGLGDSVWLEWVPKRNIICKNLAHSLWMLMAYGANVSLQVYSCYICYEYIAYKLAKDCKRYIHGRRRFHGSIEWWGVQCTVWLVRSTYNSFTNIEKVDNGLIFPNNTAKMNKAKVVVYVYSSHFDRYIIYIYATYFAWFFPTPLNISFHLEVTKIRQLTLVLLHWSFSLVLAGYYPEIRIISSQDQGKRPVQ